MSKECVFCNETILSERLIFQNDMFSVIATLGQITNGGYILIIPKEHVSCLGALDFDQARVLLQIVYDIFHALSIEYQRDTKKYSYPVIAFEHGIVGQTVQHAHLHMLPAGFDLSSKIAADFPDAETGELWRPTHLQELYRTHPRPYLYWTTPNGTAKVCWDPPAPPQYLRLVTAELLGRPERGNWRTMDPELDKKLGLETIARLTHYFK